VYEVPSLSRSRTSKSGTFQTGSDAGTGHFSRQYINLERRLSFGKKKKRRNKFAILSSRRGCSSASHIVDSSGRAHSHVTCLRHTAKFRECSQLRQQSIPPLQATASVTLVVLRHKSALSLLFVRLYHGAVSSRDWAEPTRTI
jgi:hypothetical protein